MGNFISRYKNGEMAMNELLKLNFFFNVCYTLYNSSVDMSLKSKEKENSEQKKKKKKKKEKKKKKRRRRRRRN